MSDIAKGVRTLLAATTGVTSLTSTRIYYDGVLPQNPVYPAVTLVEVSAEHVGHLNGESGLVESRVQVDAWSEQPDTANSVHEAIRTKLAAYAGAAGTETIRRAYAENRRTESVPPSEGSANWLYRRSHDYRIFHLESLPTN